MTLSTEETRAEPRRIVERLRPLGREGAKRAIRAILAKLTPLERYALAVRWGWAPWPPKGKS
jgi:hypothetical protein